MATRGAVISHWHHLVDDFNTSTLDFYTSVQEAIEAREVPDATFSRVTFNEGGLLSAKREYLRVTREKVAFDICAAPYGTGYFFSWWLSRPGPKHPWLWLGGFGLVVFVWLLMLLAVTTSAAAQRVNASMFGGDTGDAGCVAILMLGGFPALLLFLGWEIQNRHLPIDEDDVLMIPVTGWLYEKVFNPKTYFALDSALMFQESVARAMGETLDTLLTSQGLRALTDQQKQPSIRDLVK